VSGLSLLLGASAPNENEAEKTALSYKAYTKWTIDLPNETFSPVAQMIPIKHQGGEGFVAALDGPALAVDSNGDGKVDVKAKGTSGHVVLKGTGENGQSFTYAIRLANEGGWKFAAGGAMVGKIKGESVKLIDQNNDGTYDDWGVDAMIIGSGDAASYLSKVVNLGGALYELDIQADGTELSVKPFTGETGTLDLRASFESQGKLESAVVVSEDGQISFNLANAKSGAKVPAGSYRLAHGRVTAGAESVTVKAGRMRPIIVGNDETVRPEWGGPIKAEFTYTHEKGTLTIRPTDLFFFGRSGEEYVKWVPDGAPPKFIVKDAETGRELLTARFGGC
jgi:hypothetical protein